MTDTIEEAPRTMRVPLQDGAWVDAPLDPHKTVEEGGPKVLRVVVLRFRKEMPLGRIDVEEHVYHVRHHTLADFVRWSDKTTTLGLEELRLAGINGVETVQWFDDVNKKRYSISMQTLRTEGYAVRRERIGWRWITPLDDWDVTE